MSALYYLFFYTDVFLLAWDAGLLLASVVYYWMRRNGTKEHRRYFGALVKLNGGLAMALLLAVASFFSTSFHQYDPTVWFWPPLFGIVGWGALQKLMFYRDGGNPRGEYDRGRKS